MYLVQTLTSGKVDTRPRAPNRRSEIRDVGERWDFGQRRVLQSQPFLIRFSDFASIPPLPVAWKPLSLLVHAGSNTSSNSQAIPLLLPRLGTTAQAARNKTPCFSPFLALVGSYFSLFVDRNERSSFLLYIYWKRDFSNTIAVALDL